MSARNNKTQEEKEGSLKKGAKVCNKALVSCVVTCMNCAVQSCS